MCGYFSEYLKNDCTSTMINVIAAAHALCPDEATDKEAIRIINLNSDKSDHIRFHGR